MPPAVALSPEQKAVVAHRGTDLQVIACAGSGKTESISRRVAALIAEGAEPASIVAFTFTERAASELKDRITRRVADRMGEAFRDRLGPMFVGTIHAYCFRLLQDHVPQYGNYDVLDENRHAGFLSREYYRIGLSKLKAKHWAPIRDFTRTVDVLGNELIPANALVGTPLGECYSAYRQSLSRHHILTFSLIITMALGTRRRRLRLLAVRRRNRRERAPDPTDSQPSSSSGEIRVPRRIVARGGGRGFVHAVKVATMPILATPISGRRSSAVGRRLWTD